MANAYCAAIAEMSGVGFPYANRFFFVKEGTDHPFAYTGMQSDFGVGRNDDILVFTDILGFRNPRGNENR
jgi:hypothetical protein